MPTLEGTGEEVIQTNMVNNNQQCPQCGYRVKGKSQYQRITMKDAKSVVVRIMYIKLPQLILY